MRLMSSSSSSGSSDASDILDSSNSLGFSRSLDPSGSSVLVRPSSQSLDLSSAAFLDWILIPDLVALVVLDALGALIAFVVFPIWLAVCPNPKIVSTSLGLLLYIEHHCSIWPGDEFRLRKASVWRPIVQVRRWDIGKAKSAICLWSHSDHLFSDLIVL